MSRSVAQKSTVRVRNDFERIGYLAGTLERLEKKGVRLWVDAERLHFEAPSGALTAKDIQDLRASRNEVIAFLLADGDRKDYAPLAFSQLWRWQLFGLSDRRSARMVAHAVRLKGRLAVEALQRSLNILVEAQSALRTRIVDVDGTPMQFVATESRQELVLEDLTAIPMGLREGTARNLIERYIRDPIDMSAVSLMDSRLLRLADDEHVLVVVLDHMITDAHSMQLLLGELFSGYGRLYAGEEWKPTATTVQFTAYAAQQRSSHHILVEEHGPYWLERLAGWKSARFPVDKPAPGDARGWASIPLHIGSVMKKALLEWSRRNHTTLALSMLAAYAIVVARWCRSPEVLVQCQTHGRPSPDLANTMGYFASLTCLRIILDDEDTSMTVLQQVTREYCQAVDRGDSSYMAAQLAQGEFARNTIFNWVPYEPDTGAGHSPLNALAVEPFPFENVALEDIRWDNDPELCLVEREEDIAGQLYFSRERFSAAAMHALSAAYLELLEGMLSRPARPVRMLELSSMGSGNASSNERDAMWTGSSFHASHQFTAGSHSTGDL